MRHSYLKDLRRYAGIGKRRQAKGILREMLEQEPDDCFAIAELKRLEAGKELYSALDYKSYRRILHEASLESMRRIMSNYPDIGFGRMVKGKIHKLLATLAEMESRMQDKQSMSAEYLEYKKALRRELNKRTVRAGSRVAVPAGILLALLFIVVGTGWQIKHRAEVTAQAIEKAVESNDWQRVLALKGTADSGINKLLYPPIEAGINKAEAWIAHKKAIHREAKMIICSLQDGKYSIETMPIAQRALMERYLRSLPQELNDISPVWERYCDQAKLQWMQQIPDILARLRAPLPPFPEWRGTKNDSRMAEQYRLVLNSLLKEFEDDVDAYHLDPSLIQPLRDRIAQTENLLQEISAWQRILKEISSATCYADYLKSLHKLGHSTAYPPLTALAKAAENLPTENAVWDLMRDPSGKTSHAILQAKQRIMLERGATFCKEGPASPEQIEMLDDLFTTRTLRTKLYRIVSMYGDIAYSAEPYTSEGDTTARFKRAELDPQFRIGLDPHEQWREAGLRQEVVDPTGLVAAAELERDSFFIKANLPQAMGAVLNYRHKDCPALAKAYVYNILLLTIQKNENKELTGCEYSPSLQADILSFSSLIQTLGIKLRADCWLKSDYRTTMAENALQDWFNERKGRNYAAEIEKNYGDIAAVHPLYIGYVGADGQKVLCREVSKGDELWYIGQNNDIKYDLRSEAAYTQCTPYSPLFIKTKGKKKEP